MAHIVIVGNGIAGITCARHIRKNSSEAQITVISAETEHFFSRTALMYVYMGHMEYQHIKPYEDWFWEKNRINLVLDFVTSIDPESKNVALKKGSKISYDKLVLATGSRYNKFDWPGQDLPGVQGLYSYQDLELLEENTKNCRRGVITGGGLIGVELAEMLHSRKIPVTFLIREKNFWDIVLPPEESAMVGRHMREQHVDLRVETELKEIKAGTNGRAHAVVTNTGEEISCDVVGLTAGVHPNTGLAKGAGVEIKKGVLVDEFLETSSPGIYAIGDCAELRNPLSHRRAIEPVWYTGRMMGETLALTLTGNKTAYKPGVWFNSAKFFDIEYQTYGNITPITGGDENSFWWEHKNGRKGIRISFSKENGMVVGMNAMGIRQRHEVWDRWIGEQKSIGHVMAHLEDANFDPEFFDRHEDEILEAFGQQFPALQLNQKKRKKVFGLF